MEPSRAVEVDFAPPIFQFDYTYLVPAGSAIQHIADADRPGIRIGLVESHASALALRRLVTRAKFVGVELPDEAVDLIKNDKADLLAFPRDHLLIFAEKLPGSRVLTDRYGVNRVAMAVRKGRAGWLAYATEFSQEAKASGLVRAAIEHGALRALKWPRRNALFRRYRLHDRQPGFLLLGDKCLGFIRRHRMRVAAGRGELLLDVRIADDLGGVRAHFGDDRRGCP